MEPYLKRTHNKSVVADSQTSAPANNHEPDEFGMIVNDYLYLTNLKLKRGQGIYVSENLAAGIRLVMHGLPIRRVAHIYNLSAETLRSKYREVQKYISRNQRSIQPIFKYSSDAQPVDKKKQIGKRDKRKDLLSYPNLSKADTVFGIMKKFSIVYDVKFPRVFCDSIVDLESGIPFQEVIGRYPMATEPLLKIIRHLRHAKKGNQAQKRIMASSIKKLLPLLMTDSNTKSTSPFENEFTTYSGHPVDNSKSNHGPSFENCSKEQDRSMDSVEVNIDTQKKITNVIDPTLSTMADDIVTPQPEMCSASCRDTTTPKDYGCQPGGMVSALGVHDLSQETNQVTNPQPLMSNGVIAGTSEKSSISGSSGYAQNDCRPQFLKPISGSSGYAQNDCHPQSLNPISGSKHLRRWCFTWNNYPLVYVYTKYFSTSMKNVRRAVWGYSVSPSGTRHLRGYMEFTKPIKFSTVQQAMPGAHVEVTKGDSYDNYDHCTKDDCFDSIGVWMNEQKGRTREDNTVGSGSDWSKEHKGGTRENDIKKNQLTHYSTKSRISKALEAIDNGESVYKTCRTYNINSTTLYFYAKDPEIFLQKKQHGSHYSPSTYRRPPLSSPRLSSPPSSVMMQENRLGLVRAPCPTPRAVPGKVKKFDSKVGRTCLFCHQPAGREVELGKLHILNKVVVHYYCLLFSSALEQNGEDNEGILGFLPKDILKELKRGTRLKCVYCNETGATIGCISKNCKKVYHFPCGLANHAQFVFTDNFRSFCIRHRKFQKGNNIGNNVECPICFEMMVVDPKVAVLAPCCQKSSWFHRLCLQKLALSAGYFFKCPLCNDKNTFIPEMVQQGIFVPEQDASWELEPNAYQELLERPIRCDAPNCKCPGGRKNDEEGTRWEVVLCNLCGSTGIHVACGHLHRRKSAWSCPECKGMLKESAIRTKQESQMNRQNRMTYQSSSRRNVRTSETDITSWVTSMERPRKRQRLESPSTADNTTVVKMSDASEDETVDVVSEDEDLKASRDVIPLGTSFPMPCSMSMKDKNAGLTIADILKGAGSEPLSEAQEELRAYAEMFQSKLKKVKMDETSFLEALNEVGLSGRKQEGRENPVYTLTKDHIDQFVQCQFNYDQMSFLVKVFELCFLIMNFKTKIAKNKKVARIEPFLSAKPKRRTGGGNSSLIKTKKALQMRLIHNLTRAKAADLLEGNNTWTRQPPNTSTSVASMQPKDAITRSSSADCGSWSLTEGQELDNVQPSTSSESSFRYSLPKDVVLSNGPVVVLTDLVVTDGAGESSRGSRRRGSKPSMHRKCAADGCCPKNTKTRRRASLNASVRSPTRVPKRERGRRSSLPTEDPEEGLKIDTNTLPTKGRRTRNSILKQSLVSKENKHTEKENRRVLESPSVDPSLSLTPLACSIIPSDLKGELSNPNSPSKKATPLQTSPLQNGISPSKREQISPLINAGFTAAEIEDLNRLPTPPIPSRLVRNLFGEGRMRQIQHHSSPTKREGRVEKGSSSPLSRIALFGLDSRGGNKETPMKRETRKRRRDTKKYIQPTISSFFKVRSNTQANGDS